MGKRGPKRKPREMPLVFCAPGMAWVPLTRGKFALVDAEMLPRLDASEWYYAKNGRNEYAQRSLYINGRQVTQTLHRLIWVESGRPPYPHIDHKNGNGLDCRVSNLRGATYTGNQGNARLSRANRSGVKGVYWKASSQKWAAQVRSNGRNRHLGYFHSLDAAAEAYRIAARSVFGEFARPEVAARKAAGQE